MTSHNRGSLSSTTRMTEKRDPGNEVDPISGFRTTELKMDIDEDIVT